MSVLESATEAANRIIHGDTNPDDVQLVAGELLELSARLREYEEALRQANFFRDKLAERLGLVETAVVELDGALLCDEAADPDHWREHARHAMASALDLCRRATKTRQSA